MKKIAVIGIGSMGQRHISNIGTMYPDAQIYAVSSSGSLSAATQKNAHVLSVSLQEAIAFKPDFAIVASPATFHLHHTTLLLAANIPVLIEKPITGNSHEVKELMALVQQTKVPVSVAYCLRYLPAAHIVKKLLEQKKIGTIYNISAHVGQYLPDWRKNKDYRSSVSASKALGGGVLLELSHELDYLQWLVGELQYEHAILRNTKELDLEVEEIADLILTTELGAVCTIHLDFIQKNVQRYCYFIGEKGHLYWDLLENQVSLFLDNKKQIIFDEPEWDKNNMYLSMLEEFINRIEKHDNNNNLLIAQRTIELIDKIKANAIRGVKQ